MTETTEIPGASGSPVAALSPPKLSTSATLVQLFAALLSAVCPGAGHMMLGQVPKGMCLSALFAGLLCGFWPLRLLRYYPGFVTLFLSWIVLGLYSTSSAQWIRNPETGHRASNWWLVLTLPLALVLVSLTGAGVTRASGFRSFIVPSTSMEPTIQRGDHILVDIHAFRSSVPHYRDVIVCSKDSTFFIKRIIGMGGDTVQGRSTRVIVNGNLVNESYIQHSRIQAEVDWQALGTDPTQSFGPVTIPVGKYFVMGDNRDVSIDSRSSKFGFIDGGSLIGRVLYVFGTAREGARVQ